MKPFFLVTMNQIALCNVKGGWWWLQINRLSPNSAVLFVFVERFSLFQALFWFHRLLII